MPSLKQSFFHWRKSMIHPSGSFALTVWLGCQSFCFIVYDSTDAWFIFLGLHWFWLRYCWKLTTRVSWVGCLLVLQISLSCCDLTLSNGWLKKRICFSRMPAADSLYYFRGRMVTSFTGSFVEVAGGGYFCLESASAAALFFPGLYLTSKSTLVLSKVHFWM